MFERMIPHIYSRSITRKIKNGAVSVDAGAECANAAPGANPASIRE